MSDYSNYPSNLKWIAFHDDFPCKEMLDLNGYCPVCKIHPDMQSKSLMKNPNYKEKTTYFTALDHSRYDKSIKIIGLIDLFVDYDDVDDCAVDAALPLIIKALNDHFDYETYSKERDRLFKERHSEDEEE